SDLLNAIAEVLVSLPFDQEIKNILERLRRYDDPQLVMTSMVHLVKNNVPVDQAAIDKVASDPALRLTLYEQLRALGKDKMIRPRYLTARMMAESDFYEYMEMEAGRPSAVELQKKQEVVHNGVKMVIYPIRYRYEEGDDWYVGIAGPYQVNAKVFGRGEWTSSTSEKFDAVRLQSVIDSFQSLTDD
ncbi:MAG TPA: hypothetical protein VEB86_19845, partial [Chryseosolibacter sp.]|nr:hypothetical protein [Chryseosolibacter sp.]